MIIRLLKNSNSNFTGLSLLCELTFLDHIFNTTIYLNTFEHFSIINYQLFKCRLNTFEMTPARSKGPFLNYYIGIFSNKAHMVPNLRPWVLE